MIPLLLTALLVVGPAAAAQAPQDAQSQPHRISNYKLGPEDEIALLALDADEISNKPVRIDNEGYFRLPLVGRVKAGGLTVEELEKELVERLKRYIQEPQVTVMIVTFRSQPVSVLGCVNQPGVIQLEGRRTLAEMLAKAGGVRDDGSNLVRITRKAEYGALPIAGARQDEATRSFVAEVNFRAILDGRTPENNIVVLPFDVISVPRAQVIYVIGEVRKPAGFALGDKDTISVIKAIAMAEGLSPTASAKAAQIIRAKAGSDVSEKIPVNIQDIMAGKRPDVALYPEDILVVPGSYAKSAWRRSLDNVGQVVTGMLVYRRW